MAGTAPTRDAIELESWLHDRAWVGEAPPADVLEDFDFDAFLRDDEPDDNGQRQLPIASYITCQHLQNSWFSDQLPAPIATRTPSAVLSDLLDAVVISPTLDPDGARLKRIRNDTGAGAVTKSDLTFHCFPRLPVELRLIVWAMAMPSRSLHIDAATPSACLLSQRLPSPACREARVALPVHEMTPKGSWTKETWRFTKADRLSLGVNPLYSGIDIVAALDQFDYVAMQLQHLRLNTYRQETITADDMRRIKHLMVVVQTVNIRVPHIDDRDGDGMGTTQPVPPDALVIEPAGYTCWESLEKAIVGYIPPRERTETIYEVVDLRDRHRIRELLSVGGGSANRLGAMDRTRARAFCMDCQLDWCETRGKNLAVDYLNRRRGGESAGEEHPDWDGIPHMIPAVRFEFDFSHAIKQNLHAKSEESAMPHPFH